MHLLYEKLKLESSIIYKIQTNNFLWGVKYTLNVEPEIPSPPKKKHKKTDKCTF